VAVLEQIAKNTEKVLERVESRIDRIGLRLDRLDVRLDRMEDRQNSDFKWLMGMGLAGNGFLFAAMAHGFHWI